MNRISRLGRPGAVVAVAAAAVALAAGPASAADGPSIGKSISVGNSPYQVGALPALHRVVVAEAGDHTVGVIDTRTGQVVTHFPLPGKTPLAIATNKKTNTVYVGTQQDTVEVLDGNTGRRKATYQVGEHAHSIGVDEAHGRIAVANVESGTVTILGDDGGWAVGVNVGKAPTSPAFSADGNKLYVTNAESNTVSVIATGPNDYWPSVGKTIGTHFWPLQAAVNPKTGKLYFTNFTQGTVQVIDTATDNLVGSIAVGTEPIGIAVNADTNTVYVANSKSNSLSVIDGATDRVRATVPTRGQFPLGVAVTDAKTAFVSNRVSNNVNVLGDPGPAVGSAA
ncbi:YncE family protein [Amycolatopsis anabasis]|uniref:YncE family protein n=1 Tax=Amycolatopsis anabasis TaxID=1840409 RepID=UPI00131C9833|nr:YncE family protein [Amycolatopsis anabasis]